MRKWLLVLLLLPLLSFGQTKTPTQWRTEFDNHVSGSFNFGRHTGMADFVVAPYMAVDIADMYWDAFALINGYTYMWMAYGDNNYLDFVLDVVERDIDNAVNMSTADPPPQSSNYAGWNFNAFLAKPNRFGFTGTVNLTTYANEVIAGTTNPLQLGYGRRTNTNGTSAGVYIALDEGMYNRNIAQLARVMHNNISSIGTLVSNNGQTYQQRLDKLVAHLRDHVWARNFENPNVDNGHYARDVYRVNTHMSGHLAMVALCLYVIEGDQKYRTFVEQYLWDFDQIPSGFQEPTHLTPGQGLLDKLVYQTNSESYWWVAPWNKDIGGHVLQDASHAVSELQILLACYEESIGLNPPAGEPAINLTFMQRMANSIQQGYLKGYECGDGGTPSMAYRLDGSGLAYGLMSSSAAYAQFNPNIQCYLDDRTSGIDLQKIGTVGAAAYTSRVLGVGGDTGPVYTPSGTGGVTPSNFPPNVVSVRGSFLSLTVGDEYVEQGATWTDVEDGSGTISTPTSGSVPVDGANNTTTEGTYNLVYTYTDAGGASDTANLTVQVAGITNEPPTLVVDEEVVTIVNGGVYTEPTYTWTDAEDGTGTTGAVIAGDVVDVNTSGTYSVTVTYTDTGGLMVQKVVTVNVIDEVVVIANNLTFNGNPYYMVLGETNFPEYTLSPSNVTDPGLTISFSPEGILESQPTSLYEYQVLALEEGTTTMTLTSTSNPTLSIDIPVIVVNPGSIINFIIR